MYILKKVIVTCIYKLYLNLFTNLVSNWRGQNLIILKNWGTKLNQKFK